ncbi:MAG: hypothetical protein MJZ05_13425 [Fibrobacter sp.]|nr:hypothetical protein [Fibrobacter sp.]
MDKIVIAKKVQVKMRHTPKKKETAETAKVETAAPPEATTENAATNPAANEATETAANNEAANNAAPTTDNDSSVGVENAA